MVWARPPTGCARNAARYSATGSPSARAAAQLSGGSRNSRTLSPESARSAAARCSAAARRATRRSRLCLRSRASPAGLSCVRTSSSAGRSGVLDRAEPDHGHGVRAADVPVVELAEELGHLLRPANRGIVVLDLAGRKILERLDVDLVDHRVEDLLARPVADVAELPLQAPFDPGFLGHLSQGGVRGRVAARDLALRQGPGTLRLAARPDRGQPPPALQPSHDDGSRRELAHHGRFVTRARPRLRTGPRSL